MYTYVIILRTSVYITIPQCYFHVTTDIQSGKNFNSKIKFFALNIETKSLRCGTTVHSTSENILPVV